MKKITIITLFILILAACNSTSKTDDIETKEAESSTPSEQVDNEEVEETPEEPVVEDESLNESEEPTEEEKEENGSENPEEPKDTSSTNNDKNENKTPEKNETSEADTNDDLVDLTKQIFKAQNDHDYTFLQSVLSKGSKLDKKKNTFTFENVTYPHEQEFLTDNNAGDLEHRYTHENDANSIIVGFAAIDYENEYSFVIDFEFINEGGKWKMNDMDINK